MRAALVAAQLRQQVVGATQLSWYLCITLLLTLAGCSAYRVGTSSLYPPDIQTVYVPMFESDSFRRYLGERLTEAVIKEIELQTPYKVVGSPQADSVLTGRIINEAKRVIVENRFDEPRNIEYNIAVQISWVDRKNKTGHLGEFELLSGRLLRSVEVQNGERYHPGGLAKHGDSLWLPVAEYRPNSSSVIQRRNQRTLALEAKFEVPDHIGCVAVMNGRVYGGNWDSKQIYAWDTGGTLISNRDNPSGTSFQDMKAVGGQLIGSGIRPEGGAIDWLDVRDLRMLRRVRTGKTDRDVLMTHEGMAISGTRLYLLPEDSPSRLFIFGLP